MPSNPRLLHTRRARPLSFMRLHVLELFILLEFTCQVLLLSSEIGQLRQLVRITLFSSSIATLLLLSGRGQAHPAAKPAMVVLAVVIISLFNPSTNTVLAASAQIGMYLAILAPLFWVARLQVDTKVLRRVLMVIWIFQTVSASVGILQVYFPGRFEPSISIVLMHSGKGYLKGLQYRNAYGEMTWRAMGLTDIPGGAAAAGFFSALLGTAFLLTFKNPFPRLFAATTMVIGLVAIYLSNNRSSLVVLMIGEISIVWLTAVRRSLLIIRPAWGKREAGNLPRLVGAIAVASLLGFSWAVAVGGLDVSDRFETLVAEKPSDVYQKNRGHFIETTMENDLPQYPLGAGLGRWGMMNYYFGDTSNPESLPIWVEEQWTGWLIDGGIPLIVAYLLLMALRTTVRIALGPVEPELAVYAAIIFAYDVSALATCFSYTFFLSQSGLEFWLLNAALYGAMLSFQKKQARADATVKNNPQKLARAAIAGRFPARA
jgi:hypothetical protein